MFDIASSELLVVAIAALLVVGPKDLPKLMRTVGHWVRRARMMTGQFRAGFEQMMQEAEFQEERERIMKAHPNPEPAPTTVPPSPPPGETVQTFSAATTPRPAATPQAAADVAQTPVASAADDGKAESAAPEHRS